MRAQERDKDGDEDTRTAPLRESGIRHHAKWSARKDRTTLKTRTGETLRTDPRVRAGAEWKGGKWKPLAWFRKKLLAVLKRNCKIMRASKMCIIF